MAKIFDYLSEMYYNNRVTKLTKRVNYEKTEKS